MNLEPLLPLFFICLTKVRMFLETVKLLENLFWKNNTTNNSKNPLLLIGQVYSVIVSKNKTILIVWFSKIGRTFQFVKSFLKKIGNRDFTTNVVNLLFVAREGIEPPTSRLWALRATAATISRYELYDRPPLSPSHLSTSCAGCTSGSHHILFLRTYLENKSHKLK